jgi:hypothetical protein
MLGTTNWSPPAQLPRPTKQLALSGHDEFYYSNSHASAATALWLRTEGGTGSTSILATDRGGVVRETTAASSGNHVQYRIQGEPFLLDANSVLQAYGRFRVADPANINFGFGFTTSGTNKLNPTAGVPAVDGLHGILVYTSASDGALDVHVGDGTTENDAAFTDDSSGVTASMTADTWFDIAITAAKATDDRYVIDFWFNEIHKRLVLNASVVPTDEPMTLFFAIYTDNAAAEVLDIDFVGWTNFVNG